MFLPIMDRTVSFCICTNVCVHNLKISAADILVHTVLTLIPTGETTSGPHCFRAKYLGIFFYVKNLQKNS
jgi:hypothetical protein